MNGGNKLFWAVIAVLMGSSLYYGTHAEARRREVQRSEATLQDGAEVALVSVVDGDTVVVWHEEVENPKHVRFGYQSNPDKLNLFNREGLPASPFTTD